MKWPKNRYVLSRKPFLLLLAAAALTLTLVSVRTQNWQDAITDVKNNIASRIIQGELSAYEKTDDLSLITVLALSQSPLLMSARESLSEEPETPLPISEPDRSVTFPVSQVPEYHPQELTYPDNGIPAQTVKPTAAGGYTVVNGVFIKNSSQQELDPEVLSQEHFAAVLNNDVPQVLIIHTHGSEAYTLPPGQSYSSTGTCRTDDARYSVIRVGDEVATVLSSYGISVLHDRALYDAPYYDGAYDRAADAIAAYQEKYPSLTYIIDLHRDAVQDVKGNQYKLVSDDPTIAQISMVMGSSHEGWEENLKLAIAVSRAVESECPTVMRPITLRNSNYNQSASLGMILVEVGAAGNSLEEAVHAGQIFARGFAQAVINNAAVG